MVCNHPSSTTSNVQGMVANHQGIKPAVFLKSLQFQFSISCVQRMHAIATLEGYNISKELFVIKELSIIKSDGTSYYLFLKPPRDIFLSAKERYTVRYITSNINNLLYDDGETDYEEVYSAMKLLESCTRIYTHGELSKCVLQKFLPNSNICNAQKRGFQLPKTIAQATTCKRIHPARFCSKVKAEYLLRWLNCWVCAN